MPKPIIICVDSALDFRCTQAGALFPPMKKCSGSQSGRSRAAITSASWR